MTDPAKDHAPSVRLTGLDIPFGDLVIFYFKAAFAAVPVGIFFGLVYYFFAS